MNRLFGLGLDPVTEAPLGPTWRVPKPVAQRITDRVAQLPTHLGAAEKAAAVAQIVVEEEARRMPVAVSGFDLTFTVPKSASVLWALADPATQTAIAQAHNQAVADCLRLLETHALFTRVGRGGVAQVPTRGALAAGFDHWDSRTGDPNLHTHLVIANKVQGADGVWRSIDAKGLYAGVVAISETYDALVADHIAAATGTTWSVRLRPQRSALFEIDGVSPELLAEFSHRSLQIETTLRDLLTDFQARNNRSPSRPEMLRIRQHATRLSRPVKHLRALPELLMRWRERATKLLPTSVEEWLRALTGAHPHPLRVDQLSSEQVTGFAKQVLDAVTERRSTWTRWNLIAEAARATKPLRMATATDRVQLLERVAQTAIDGFCLALDPPDLTPTPAAFRRPDGSSAFRRHRAQLFTSPAVLAAETRLLAAAHDLTAPRTPAGGASSRPFCQSTDAVDGASPLVLAPDQAAAVAAITSSGRRLDVLVGPAGSGKTTTMRALKHAWETEHGPGSVIGLAPSAAAARELAAALRVGCENTAKWIHETTQPLTGPHPAATTGRFRLRAGQLLIVDEASLAGTLVLDELTRQTTAAGAKLLLVGDHRQLSSVQAGGAFGLLAADTGATELTSLWRFHQPWEAAATGQLRTGDPAVIDTYAAHHRLHQGPAEVMANHAYQAWARAISNGFTALLIASDNTTVAALNDQARADRITAGHVEAGGVRLHDGTTAGVGDVVLTRANNRAVRTSTGAWVRNGDLWTVTHRSPDGALTVRRNRTHTNPPGRESLIVLDPDYVGANVELGYATTAHRAQGVTVDAAFALLRPGMAREVAYVAMTRGRHTNHAYIATDTPDLGYDGGPEPAVTGRQILATILATAGAEMSATQTLRQLHHDAESLATLGAIHETLVQTAEKHRWTELVTATLGPDIATAVLTSPAYGPLVAALRQAEHRGYPAERVLAEIVAAGPLTATTDGPGQVVDQVRDPAAILHWRLAAWGNRAVHADHAQDPKPLLAGLFTPAGPNPNNPNTDLMDAIAGLEQRITARARTVSAQLINDPPPWLARLGPQPTNPRSAASWRAAAAAIAVYRDAYTITDTTHPLGTQTPADHAQARARRRALAASTAVIRNLNRPTSRKPFIIAPTAERTPTL